MDRSLTSAIEEQVRQRYAAGESGPVLAVQLGVSKGTILNIVRRTGGTPRTHSEANRRCTLNHAAFDNADSDPEAAYWIGVLITDGWITTNCNGSTYVGLGMTDKEHVYRFRSFIGSTHTVSVSQGRWTTNPEGRRIWSKPSAKLQVASPHMAMAVSRFGVTYRKSATASVHLLEGCPHFWRGCLDGDGTVRICRDGRPIISLVGAHKLVSQFAAYVRSVTATDAEVSPHKSIWEFAVKGTPARDVAAAIYGSPGEALPRKLAAARHAMAWTSRRRDWHAVSLPDLESLHAIHGDWTSVADHLGITIFNLRRLLRSRRSGVAHADFRTRH